MSIGNISPYGLLGALGFTLGFLYLFFICKLATTKFQDIIYVYTWAAIGAIIGAKLLYIVLELKVIYCLLLSGNMTAEYILSILNGGFVFYGGLAGALIATYSSCKFFHLDVIDCLALVTPTMPLAHAFGRVGCAIVGCCYGIETDGLGIIYQKSQFAPLDVKLFPVQLIEASCNIFIFLLLMYLFLKNKYRNKLLLIYLTLYSIIRFVLEFFRGDLDRGSWWLLSTSQWISIGILLITTTYILNDISKKNR